MEELKRAKRASNEEVDAFLKGSDPQEHIIKIECGYDDTKATIIWRDENFVKHYSQEPFYPFCWAKQEAGRLMFGGNRTTLKLEMQAYGITCKGLIVANEEGEVPERMENGYRVLFYATRPMSNTEFTRFFDKAKVPLRPKTYDKTYGKNLYKTVAPNEQFMIATGKRLFKGYESYDDILRLQFDIETTGLDKKNDLIDQIGIRTNKGFEKVIEVEGDTREEKIENGRKAINEMFDILDEIDPDVVAGYNSEGFDFEFFDVFLKEHFNADMFEETKRDTLKNGCYKKKKQSVLKLGGEMEYYYPTVMWGKHITDCLFSVRRAQALDSNMKKATLKYVTKYSKINKKNRVYVPGSEISTVWNDLGKNYAFCNEDGDWYRYDPNYVKPKVELKKPSYSVEEYNEMIAEDRETWERYQKFQETFDVNNLDNTMYLEEFFDLDSGAINEYERLYSDDETGESLYAAEAKRLADEYESKNSKKGFRNDKFTLYTRNTIEDGYELVTGRYIVQRYLLDDIWETDKVELRYNESNFLVGKMLPVNFERMCTMGTATIWKYIMMAWSYEHDLAIPLETSSRSFTGGLSRLLTVGYIPNVQKLDYNSLYPSIILSFGIKSPIDISGAMPAMLEYILTQREYFKGLKGDYGKEAKKYGKQYDEEVKQLRQIEEYMGLDDKAFAVAIANNEHLKLLQEKQEEAAALSTRNDKMQLPLKITGNAYFGSFGAGGGVFPWSDIDCAEETTCCGRQMLRLMLKWFTDLGYEGIVCDTDGMNFKQPPQFRYTEEHPYISTGMNRNTKKGEKYVGPWGDLAEFNDLFMRVKNGLDIDEFVPSSCYLARKNYMDLLDVEKQKVKLVGNTIKSKKMPIYIEKFVDDVVRDLLNDRGYEYLEKYYDKIEEIYNLRIPLKDIATVGKIKISLEEYKTKCNERTKSGSKKARQAWYELAIKNNIDVHMGDSIYYINTGTKKGDSDVKRITHFYEYINGEKVDVTKEYEKEWNALKKQAKLGDTEACAKVWDETGNKPKVLNLENFIKRNYPNVWDEDELIFNCVMVPNDIVNDEEDHYCDEDFEYNVAKYIETFNNRIKPHLVCFDKSIRMKQSINKKGEIVEENNIIITNPKDRKQFTREQTKLVSGQPYKESDQDTYEQLMTMEDKEIRFWLSVNKEPVYWRECGMDWDVIKKEYIDRMDQLKQDGIREEVEQYQKIIQGLTEADVDALIDDGVIPEEILKICDNIRNSFISKKWGIKLGDLYDIIDKDFGNTETDDDDIELQQVFNNKELDTSYLE